MASMYMYHVCMSSLSCWCNLHVYPSSLSVPPFFPFPLLLLLPLLPFLTPSPRSNTSFTIRPLLEHLNSFDHYVDDILAYKRIRSYLDGVALQSDVNIIVNWIESTGLELNLA